MEAKMSISFVEARPIMAVGRIWIMKIKYELTSADLKHKLATDIPRFILATDPHRPTQTPVKCTRHFTGKIFIASRK
jgi:hypothetical protein